MYNEDRGGCLIPLIVLAITIIFLWFLLGPLSYKESAKEWNNGFCDCGGKYIFTQAVGHQHTTEYMFTCDSCGKTIEVRSSFYNKEINGRK